MKDQFGEVPETPEKKGGGGFMNKFRNSMDVSKNDPIEMNLPIN